MSHTPPPGVPVVQEVTAFERLEDKLWASLTPREREVSWLLARGETCREIAAALGMSLATANTHRTNILKKLNQRNIVHFTRWMIREGKVKL
jgi:DNA-binding CsgD family transcriptional regulator